MTDRQTEVKHFLTMLKTVKKKKKFSRNGFIQFVGCNFSSVFSRTGNIANGMIDHKHIPVERNPIV